MKIRFTAPEWFKRKRKERNERLLEDTHSKTYQQNVDWGEEISYILPSIAKIIPAFVVLMVGLALVGPMSDAFSEVRDNITDNVSSGNLSNIIVPNFMLDIMSNKFFLFLFFVLVPFLMFKNIFRGLGGVGL